MPDYTHQLDQIVQALNRPATPAWIIALVSASFGALSSVVVQTLMTHVSEQQKRHKARKIIYTELQRLYHTVKGIYCWEPKTAPSRQELLIAKAEQLRTHLGFRAEDYIKANQDVFVQLDEQDAITSIYGFFHQVNQSMPENCEETAFLTLSMVFAYYKQGRLKPRYLDKIIRVDFAGEKLRYVPYAMTSKGRGIGANASDVAWGPVKDENG